MTRLLHGTGIPILMYTISDRSSTNSKGREFIKRFILKKCLAPVADTHCKSPDVKRLHYPFGKLILAACLRGVVESGHSLEICLARILKEVAHDDNLKPLRIR